MTPSLQISDALAAGAAQASRAAAGHLLREQHEKGFWWADLTADTTLEADYILLELWSHPPDKVEGEPGIWNPPSRARIDRAVRSMLARQLPDGGFNIYPQGPADVSASVKAYFSLKVAGVAADSGPMVRLRDTILRLGGIQAANSYVKINLSLFGLYPRHHVPSVPPEIMLAGNSIYEMSSWTRAIVIPLAIVQSSIAQFGEGTRAVPAGFDIGEIFKQGVSTAFQPAGSFFSGKTFFHKVDAVFKWWEKMGPKFIRRRAVQAAEQWMLDHFRASDGLGAIYPSMQYAIMALDVLGYAPDHPARAEARKQFDNLLVDDGERFFFQPCFSVVWDTAIAAFALGESGEASKESLSRCAGWLLTREVRTKGDWSIKRPKLEPSGWYFEFANEFYPDIDDTAMVLLALSHMQAGDRKAQRETETRAVNWLLGMQGSDGGWAAFDVDNNLEILSDVPFADHNAMLDPTCPDITGRVMEALCRFGVDPQSKPIQRGVAYLLRTQEQDGSWYGRWGVNYIYGTFLALRGLKAAGYDDREAPVLRAGEWLRSIQNPDGGWGESCQSYDDRAFRPAPSTPSQTAWAILGLIAGGDDSSSSLHKGVEYLIETQRSDGSWAEGLATGTGFPKVFYLSYHSYRNSFPLLALSTYWKHRGVSRGSL